MKKVYFLVLLTMQSSFIFASQWHTIEIRNNSNDAVIVNSAQDQPYGYGGLNGRCIKGYSFGQNGANVKPHGSTIIQWQDSNSFSSCRNKDKWALLQITIYSHKNPGIYHKLPFFIGMNHRQLGGSTWYNGFFLATYIDPNNIYTVYGDMDPRLLPPYIKTYCVTGVNKCIGPYSQMEVVGRTDYNWARMFQIEAGWVIEIDEVSDECIEEDYSPECPAN